MNKTKKLFLAVAASVLIAPSIALAAWWNPLSWFNHWGMGAVSIPKTVVVEKNAPISTQKETFEKIAKIAECRATQKPAKCLASFPLTVSECENIKIDGTDDEKYKLAREKLACLSDIAAGTGNALVCERIKFSGILDVILGDEQEIAMGANKINVCIWSVARENKDVKICDLIKDAKGKTTCVTYVQYGQTSKTRIQPQNTAVKTTESFAYVECKKMATEAINERDELASYYNELPKNTPQETLKKAETRLAELTKKATDLTMKCVKMPKNTP